MVPDYFRSVERGAVVLYRGSAVGAGSIVMPGVTIGESAAVGALSLVKHDVSARDIVAGCPARKIGERVRGVNSIEQEMVS
jgi:galactoside O-acetyltransferase